MRKLLIIIHGRRLKIPFKFKAFFKIFYSLFGVDASDDKWPNKLKNYIEKSTEIDVKIFHWSGGILEKSSLKPAGSKLAKLVDNHKNYSQIVLFCKSIGGRVGEIAINETKYPDKVNKIIYVASPHKSNKVSLPNSVKLTNVYSNKDIVLSLANMFLYGGMGKKSIINGENIILKNLNHSDFNKNIAVHINNKKLQLFDFYKNIILN